MRRLWFCFLGFSLTLSQEPSRFYLRKSISYYDGILLPNDISVPAPFIELAKDKLKQAIFLARFDYNQLPQTLQVKAERAIAGMSSVTVEELGSALERLFVPEIVKILSIQRDFRALELVNQEERINFLTTKAKESGVTADDLEKVMNAAYLFIPFITAYSRAVQGNRIDINIEGGIIWYHILTRSDPPRLIPLVKKSSRAFGSAMLGKKYYEFVWAGKEFNAEEFATLNAIRAYVKNLQTFTRLIPEFRLTAEIVSVDKGNITFKLGTKEGLKMDDKFDIVEFLEDTSGIVKTKSIGCALITKVANNQDTSTIRYSKAKTFIGYAEPGMLVLERPRLPIEIALRFISYPLERKGIQIQNLGIELGLDFSVSNLFRIPHFYVPFNLGYGFENHDNPPNRYYEIGLGLAKKFYLPRFSIGPLVKTKLVSDTSKAGFGVEFSGVGEFYLTPDLALGLKGGYGLGEITEELKPKGLVWSIHFSYQPPFLPFDPLGFLRGILGI